MITIHSGSVRIEIEGGATLHVDDEAIVLEDGSEATLASNESAGGVRFEHEETDDHEAIYWEAIAALGLEEAPQSRDRRWTVHVVGDGGLPYRAWREWSEGWGVGTSAGSGSEAPSVAPAGRYLVTAFLTEYVEQ